MVAVGADKATHMQVTAKLELKGNSIMEPQNKETIEEAILKERNRVGEIKAICGGEFPELEAKAISEGWDKAKTSEEVLAKYREARPKSVPTISVKRGVEANAKHIECALALRAGISGTNFSRRWAKKRSRPRRKTRTCRSPRSSANA